MVEVLKIFVVTFVAIVTGLEVIPERTYITYINPKYLNNASTNVRRNGRRSPYFINLQFTSLTTMANNVTIHTIFYEFLHNEFKRSFVEMKFKLCDLVNKDKIFSPVLKRVGLNCPMPPGFYKLNNMSLIEVPFVDAFPLYKWPFEKAKVASSFYTNSGKELIAEGYGVATFKQKNNKAIGKKS